MDELNLIQGSRADAIDLDLLTRKGPPVPIALAETREELKLENTRLKQRLLALSVRLGNYELRDTYLPSAGSAREGVEIARKAEA